MDLIVRQYGKVLLAIAIQAAARKVFKDAKLFERRAFREATTFTTR